MGQIDGVWVETLICAQGSEDSRTNRGTDQASGALREQNGGGGIGVRVEGRGYNTSTERLQKRSCFGAESKQTNGRQQSKEWRGRQGTQRGRKRTVQEQRSTDAGGTEDIRNSDRPGTWRKDHRGQKHTGQGKAGQPKPRSQKEETGSSGGQPWAVLAEQAG